MSSKNMKIFLFLFRHFPRKCHKNRTNVTNKHSKIAFFYITDKISKQNKVQIIMYKKTCTMSPEKFFPHHHLSSTVPKIFCFLIYNQIRSSLPGPGFLYDDDPNTNVNLAVQHFIVFFGTLSNEI